MIFNPPQILAFIRHLSKMEGTEYNTQDEYNAQLSPPIPGEESTRIRLIDFLRTDSDTMLSIYFSSMSLLYTNNDLAVLTSHCTSLQNVLPF